MTRPEIRKLDKEFSLRIRAKGKCERCGNAKKELLQTSHIYSRRYISIRWHPLNATCFCAGCHWWYGLNPLDGAEWIRDYLGPTKYHLLKKLKQRLSKGMTPDSVREEWTAYGL